MDREEYFASRLEAGKYLSQEELDELINSFDVDDIQTAVNMVPVRFNGRVWLVGFRPDPLFIYQPVEGEEWNKGEWYPIMNPEDLEKQYQSELLVQKLLSQD